MHELVCLYVCVHACKYECMYICRYVYTYAWLCMYAGPFVAHLRLHSHLIVSKEVILFKTGSIRN